MKTQIYLLLMFISFVSLEACNGTTSTTTTSDSSSTTKMNPGDSSITTTTTTTTTVTHHQYTGTFMPQPNTKYLDLKTKKQVSVKVDTNSGSVVNSETNQPIELFVIPATHDTVYGQTGNVVNNYITKDEGGNYRVDTIRIHDMAPQSADVNTSTSGDNDNTTKSKSKSKPNKEKAKEK